MKEKNLFQKLKEFWLRDVSFVALFLILLFFIFIIPILTEFYDDVDFLIELSYLILYSTLIFSTEQKYLRKFVLILFASLTLLKVYRLYFESENLFVSELILSLVMVMVFIYMNLQLLFRNKEINVYRILGAVNIYLLMGVYGAISLTLIGQFHDNILSGNTDLFSSDNEFGMYVYYSLVSVTTVGYGDVYPNNVIVKQLSIFLSTFGILYPAIVIALLINEKVAKKRS